MIRLLQKDDKVVEGNIQKKQVAVKNETSKTINVGNQKYIRKTVYV